MGDFWTWLFGRKIWRRSSNGRRVPPRSYRPSFDALEARELLATTIFNIAGGQAVQEPLTTSESKSVPFTISVTGMGGPPGDASITYTASSESGDTATAGVDYQVVSGVLNLGPSHVSETIYVPILRRTG
jgi:hypothetical protein